VTKTQQAKPRAGQLKLSLLGIPEVRLGSRQLAFRTRKVQALLVYLALEPGFHSRDKLIALLWPDADQSKGRGNLRMALARLRDDLEEASSVLLIQRDAIGIQTHALNLDVQVLETAFNQAGSQAGNQAGAVDLEEQLVAAVQLFRGDLLEGFYLGDAPEFDDWLVAEREVIRDRIDALLERLTALQRQSGKLTAALETAQRRIRLEPLNEAAHRQVIELHLAGENRSAALEAFHACAKLLQRELGLEPDAQTQSLLGRIQTSSVSVSGVRVPSINAPNVSVPSLVPAAQSIEPTRLVGREREWAQMEAAWQAGQAIVLHGAPGVGKSRLLLEFAASRGAYLHWLGRPGDASIPYGTHARTFKSLCEALGSAGLPNWVRSELARIVPGLGKAPPAISNDGERLRFLEAKAEALELFFAKGHTAPVYTALVYDDLQFVDSASLEAAWYVLNKFLPAVPGKPRPILGFRTDELSTPFLQTLQQAVGSGVAVMIEVKPLEPQAVAQMLQDLNLSDQLGPNLHRFTGGNPLFLLETLRSLTERGGLESLTPERFENRRRMAGLARSPKVQAIIERRLERLSNPALDLSRVAALMGEYFSFELGAKVLGKEPLETARVAEELEAAQVLRGARFSHDLIFESVLEKIPETFLRLLHEQILNALEGREVPPVVRLKHAIGATSAQAITQYALAAAEEASKLYAHEEIFSLLKQAANLFEGLGLPAEAARILTTLAAAMTHTGRVIESLETHHQALDLYQHLRDADSLAQVHLQLSLLYRTLGEAQQSQHFAQMALEHFRQRGDLPHVARALWRLGEAHWWLREYAQAQVHLLEAHELGQQLRDPEVTVWVQKTLGQNAYFLGQPAQALEYLQAAVEGAAALNDRIALGWVHFDMARVQLAMGLYEDARKHNQAALDLFEQSGHKAAIRVTKVELGQLAALDGRLEEAKILLTHSYQAVLESRENDAFSDMLIADATLLMRQDHKEIAAMLVQHILAHPLKDNPFAHVRAEQVLKQLEQELSPAKIAHAREQARDTAVPEIVALLERI
jgi:DNA-binding SARP family transcriptional activator/tetratricopeptide (TPR) repeat protein